jgi:hypothetical protein
VVTTAGDRADIVAIDPRSRTVRLVQRLESTCVQRDWAGVCLRSDLAPLLGRLAVARDGAVWVSKTTWRQNSQRPGDGTWTPSLLRIDPDTGSYQEFPAPSGDAVWWMTPGAGGDVWITLLERSIPGSTAASSKLFRVGSDGAFEEIRNRSFWISGLAVTADGAAWYTTEGRAEKAPAYLVRVDPKTRRQEPIEAMGRPVNLTGDPNGTTLWYVNFVERGHGAPRSLVRVDTASTAPNMITAENVLTRGLGAFVNCRSTCQGVARIKLAGDARASISRTGRPAAVLGTRRFRREAGTALVRVPLARRGKALLRRLGAARLTLEIDTEDRRRSRTAKREFQIGARR